FPGTIGPERTTLAASYVGFRPDAFGRRAVVAHFAAVRAGVVPNRPRSGGAWHGFQPSALPHGPALPWPRYTPAGAVGAAVRVRGSRGRPVRFALVERGPGVRRPRPDFGPGARTAPGFVFLARCHSFPCG